MNWIKAIDEDWTNELTIHLKSGTVGLIHFDLVELKHFQNHPKSTALYSIMLFLNQVLNELQKEFPAILLKRSIGEDFYLYVSLSNHRYDRCESELKVLRDTLKHRVEKQLLSFFDAEPNVTLNVGHSILFNSQYEGIDGICYKAMKQAIRETKLSSDVAYENKRIEFNHILQGGLIHSVYQPIVSLNDASIFGYESLTRGPQGSIFQSPLELFDFAEKDGQLYTLDRLAREKAIQGFRAKYKYQRVFINLPSNIIHDPQFTSGKTLSLLQAGGLQPHNVVFEVTERSSIEDFSTVKKVLRHYRNQGYQIAIDDAGAGYSSLQAIAELQPDFIKVDRSLIQDIHVDKTKEYMLETFVNYSMKMNIGLIAEGIEKHQELFKLMQMGIHYGQGFLLGYPEMHTQCIRAEIGSYITEKKKMILPLLDTVSITDLSVPVKIFEIDTTVSEVSNFFTHHKEEVCCVIVKNNQPVGLVMRDMLFQHLAAPFGNPLYWNKSISNLMEDRLLIVDASTALEQVSRMAMLRDKAKLYDVVVITENKKMSGIVTVQAMLESITKEKIEFAKVANPLTGLPGNIQIHRELTRRIVKLKDFQVIYIDLDHFKWFNDSYGFQKGDEVIQLTSEIMQRIMENVAYARPDDFIGHIGGDDFIIVSQSEHLDGACHEIIRLFDGRVKSMLEEMTYHPVKDRHGHVIPNGTLSISLGLLYCECCSSMSPQLISNAAAELKKQAKQVQGSTVMKSRLGQSQTSEHCSSLSGK